MVNKKKHSRQLSKILLGGTTQPQPESRSPGESAFKFETDLSSGLCDDSIAPEMVHNAMPSMKKEESMIEETKRDIQSLTP